MEVEGISLIFFVCVNLATCTHLNNNINTLSIYIISMKERERHCCILQMAHFY